MFVVSTKCQGDNLLAVDSATNSAELNFHCIIKHGYDGIINTVASFHSVFFRMLQQEHIVNDSISQLLLFIYFLKTWTTSSGTRLMSF